MKKLLTSILSIGMVFAGANVASAYTVEKGDTLSQIADEKGVSLHSVIKQNPQIENPDLIYLNQEIKVGKHEVNDVTVDPSKVDVLARLVRAESENQSYAGKLAVAQVVMNRVSSEDFPNDVRAVIYQNGQFSPVANGMIHRQASKESIRAAEQALNVGGNENGALYFYNPATASGQSWFNTKQTAKVIGNHTFKY